MTRTITSRLLCRHFWREATKELRIRPINGRKQNDFLVDFAQHPKVTAVPLEIGIEVSRIDRLPPLSVRALFTSVCSVWRRDLPC